MVYEFALRFSGPEIDSPEVQRLVKLVAKLNQSCGLEAFAKLQQFFGELMLLEDQEYASLLWARLTIESRYDRGKPRIKSQETRRIVGYG